MSEKMALKNKKQMKQKSSRSKGGDSVTFSGRCKSIKMEDDVDYIELNPCITDSREAIRQLYQDAVVVSPAPSSCTYVSPDSEYGSIDLENHPARRQMKKERDARETHLSPLDEFSYATPSPFTTPTPPLSADRSRAESPYRVACFTPDKDITTEVVKRTPSPLAAPPDYAFRVSPTSRRSPRLFNKRSPSPEWSQSSRKSPRKLSEEAFKVPSVPARPSSLDAPSTSGYVPFSSSGAGPDPSPSPSSDSGSTATSSFSSGSALYYSNSSGSGSGPGSGSGSGSGSGASSISGSVSIPDPSYSSSERSSPVEKPEDFSMLLDPFKVCTIKNFIYDQDYLEKLRKYLTFKLSYEKRSADMFEYYQGNDAEFSKNPLIQSLEYTFIDKLLPFMSYMFGFPLRKDKLSIGASKYRFTNYLCCHDDVYDDKRIAFVLYLTKKWKKEYGGTLDFFRKNKHNDPTKPATCIIPEYNRLVFFEISPTTHHQVSEVILPDHDRITINGWFHGVFPPSSIIRVPEPQISEIRAANVADDHIYIENWMHQMYFSRSRQMRIQALFKKNGYAVLPGFLRMDKFNEVVEALREADGWMFIGPPNRRRYEVLPEDLLPKVVKDCLRVFICEAMFLTMFNFTGCKLHALAFAAPEVEIQLKFAKYRMDETGDDLGEVETEILDVATAKERGERIAANVIYGEFPTASKSPESPKKTITPEKPSTSRTMASPEKPSTSRTTASPEKPSTSRIIASPEKPSTSRTTASPEKPSSPKRTVTSERPPTPEKPEFLKKLASPKRTVPSEKPPTPEKPASLRKPTPWKKPEISPKPGTSTAKVVKERSTTWLKDKRLDPRATIIIRRWQPGSYSLATDDEEVLAPQGVLDVHFAFDHVAGTCETHGGYISYVNKETGEEFYRCNPQENVLHMVWLPPSEYRFIKYHNVLSKQVYYDINVIYKE